MDWTDRTQPPLRLRLRPAFAVYQLYVTLPVS